MIIIFAGFIEKNKNKNKNWEVNCLLVTFKVAIVWSTICQTLLSCLWQFKTHCFRLGNYRAGEPNGFIQRLISMRFAPPLSPFLSALQITQRSQNYNVPQRDYKVDRPRRKLPIT